MAALEICIYSLNTIYFKSYKCRNTCITGSNNGRNLSVYWKQICQWEWSQVNDRKNSEVLLRKHSILSSITSSIFCQYLRIQWKYIPRKGATDVNFTCNICLIILLFLVVSFATLLCHWFERICWQIFRIPLFYTSEKIGSVSKTTKAGPKIWVGERRLGNIEVKLVLGLGELQMVSVRNMRFKNHGIYQE